jgi:hypothetical protein
MRLDKVGTVLPQHIIIGKSDAKYITDQLGKPNSQTNNSATYFLPAYEGEDKLVFYFRSGKLAIAEWNWFID